MKKLMVLFFVVGLYGALQAQEPVDIRFVVVKGDSLIGASNIRVVVKIPVDSNQFKEELIFTNSQGYARVKMDKRFSVEEIQVLAVEQAKVLIPINRNGVVLVQKVLVPKKKYSLILTGYDKQPIKNAFLVFKKFVENKDLYNNGIHNDKRYRVERFNRKGRLRFESIPFRFQNLASLKIEVRQTGMTSGTYTVYKKGSKQAGKYMYWTKEGQTIQVRLPITKNTVKYFVLDTEGNVIPSYRLDLKNKGKSIKAEQDGSISIRLMLDKTLVDSDKVDWVGKGVISVNQQKPDFIESEKSIYAGLDFFEWYEKLNTVSDLEARQEYLRLKTLIKSEKNILKKRGYEAKLGYCQILGKGIEKNIRAGIKEIKESAMYNNQQDSISVAILGDVYYLHLAKQPKLAKNLHMAVYWYLNAAKKGLKYAQMQLAYIYKEFLKDEEKAKKWLIKANGGKVPSDLKLFFAKLKKRTFDESTSK